MPRVTRNNASGPLESLPYGPTRKRRARPVIEEERDPVAEEEGAATGRTGLGELEAATQEIREFNIPKVGRQDNGPSSTLPLRPRKRTRATMPVARSDDVAEAAGARKAAEPVTELDKTRSPTGTPGPQRSPRKSLLRDSVTGGTQETTGKPRSSARNSRSRSSLAAMEAREKGLTEETERRMEEGISSEDEEGGGARLSASHDPLQLKEKQLVNRGATLSSLRTEQVPSSSEDGECDLLPADRSQESPEKVVEELMNSVVTSAITQAEQEVEDSGSEGDDIESSPNDDEDVDEAVRHQLSREADGGTNDKVEVQPEPVIGEENDCPCGMSLVTAFKAKLEESRQVLQTFKEQLKATADIADQLMKLRTGIDYRSGYTRILQEIIRTLAEEEHPDNGALEELADFALDISSIVSGTREAHRDVKALLEDLNAGIISGTKSAWAVETMLGQKGFREKVSHDGINWESINRNLVARENEILVLKPKPTDPQTPRRSARSNSSRYRTQEALPTPEAGPPLPLPAIPPSHGSLSDPESLGSTAPVIGDDAPVEVVRIESFGSRPSNAHRRSKRRRESEGDDSPQVREDRAWSSPELKALFRRLTQVQKAEPGKTIVLDSRSGYPRTKEEILTKAKEIKEDMMRSGRAGSLKPTWDNI